MMSALIVGARSSCGLRLAPHVFGEVLGLHEFADVVEIRADAADGGVGADGFGGGFGEVRDDEAVVVGAGRLDRQALEQRMIQVGELPATKCRW